MSLVGRKRVNNIIINFLIGGKVSSSQRVKVKKYFLMGWRVQYNIKWLEGGKGLNLLSLSLMNKRVKFRHIFSGKGKG